MKVIYLLLIIILALAGCDISKRNNLIILIDNSLTVPENVFERYIQTIQQSIVANMGSQDRITIQFIDGCSQSLAERIYSIDLATMNFSSNADGINFKEDSNAVRLKRFVSDSVLSEIKKVIIAKRKERIKCNQFTDIISALNEVKSLVNKKKNYGSTKDKILNTADGEENYEYATTIIIFSDMINEDKQKLYDFTKMGRIGEAQVNKKIKDLENSKTIPNLKGVNIFVYGATSTKEAGVFANKQIENVKLFWDLFFQSTGADMKGYGYDTELELKNYMAKTD